MKKALRAMACTALALVALACSAPAHEEGGAGLLPAGPGASPPPVPDLVQRPEGHRNPVVVRPVRQGRAAGHQARQALRRGDPRREDLCLRHQRDGPRLRSQGPDLRPAQGSRGPGAAGAADQHHHRQGRDEIRGRSRPRAGRRLRPRRRIPESLRRTRNVAAGRRRPVRGPPLRRGHGQGARQGVRQGDGRGAQDHRRQGGARGASRSPDEHRLRRRRVPVRDGRRQVPDPEVRPRRALQGDVRQARRQPGALRAAEGDRR